MAEDLDQLKANRAKIKAKLTRFNTFINHAGNQSNYTEIQTRLDTISNLLESFETIESQIEELSDQDYESQIENFENEFYKSIGKAKSFLVNNSAVSTSSHSSNNGSNISSRTRESSQLSIKLPTIELPSFNGEPSDWITFRDTFNSLIDENANLSNIQKLHYLKACLKGEAINVISTVENTSDNYDLAWNLLKERYDNKRIIVQRHIKNLFDLPTISRESASSIRSILDNFQTNLRSLKNLKENTDQWDSLLIHLIVSKLDRQSHKEWEKTLKGATMPTLKQLIEFLTEKCQVLESMTFDNSNGYNNGNKSNSKPLNSGPSQVSRQSQYNPNKRQNLSALTISCPYCEKSHRIHTCSGFLNLSPEDRGKFARSKRLCFNCLVAGHPNTECRSKNCKRCDRKHNTLLHLESKTTACTASSASNEICDNGQSQLTKPLSTSEANDSALPTKTRNMQVFIPGQVMLATAVVDILAEDGSKKSARVLLDAGAMSNFMTESFANSLGRKFSKVNIAASGLNKLETRIKQSVQATIFSKAEQFDADMEFLIVPSVCDVIPMSYLNKTDIEIPSYIRLADPNFNVPSNIDALIGAELYYDLLNSGQIKINNHSAKLISTRLGWVIAGKLNGVPKSKKLGCFVNLHTIRNQLERFWEIEELPEVKHLSEEDSYVEEHFKSTTTRNIQGHYVVKLPFNLNLKDKLGESFKIAEKRLYALERRFKKNPELKKQYIDVMREYINDGHMVEVDPADLKNRKFLFLPHQAVIKETSSTTKVRVVIDASSPSSTGYSLNNTLFKGPNLTPEIFATLAHFRIPIIAFIADIKKMYLSVFVTEEDSYYQLIMWRENETENIRFFRVIKVIFGETSSSYLASRSLIQVAEDEIDYPVASEIVNKRFHVDNVASGKNSIKKALTARDQLISLLDKGGFVLRQWAANDSRITDSLPENLKFQGNSKIVQTLGIHWDTESDLIIFNVSSEILKIITKRVILSDIMTIIYDVLGLAGPIIVKLKIIMQELWRDNASWDEKVPEHIVKPYIQTKNELNQIKKLEFPRKCIIVNYVDLQIHGFCDASEKAYGACIYIRSRDENGQVLCRLICSKSRVAPLNTITLARLELCAALLLAKLLKVTLSALDLQIQDIVLWSDSSIALQWIATEPFRLKTFVANRVSTIRHLTTPSWWRHVPSTSNPADLISRGQFPLEFLESKIWSQGPEWLVRSESEWPKNKFELTPLPDEENKKQIALFQETSKKNSFLHQWSSFGKLNRIMAYILRFLHNSRKDNEKYRGALTSVEYAKARNKIIIMTQHEIYINELEDLRKQGSVKKTSNLKALNPYIDSAGIIRVGGRIRYTSTNQEKNAIILPKHHVTEMIIRETHVKHLHSGINSTLNAVRFQYWPINGRSQVKTILKKCITCCKANGKINNLLMGDLPAPRVSPSYPFKVTGVDYCGPFIIKEKKFRNRNTIKVYVSVFVCFATKACHLEVVHDLTSESFIAALERFFARRGACTDIHSDNGTNFVGANNEIKELHKFLMSENHNEIIKNHLSPKGITWHFIPPRSPHMGGLWEAAVKSFKRHLLRSVNPSLFTYEEFVTLTTKIEAILNSRPLTPLSTDPNDLRALTPGDFLIGRPLTSIPDPSLLHLNENRLSNFQHIQYLKQQFWIRWSNEYLQELNVRSKWQQQSSENIKIGTMVTLQEDDLPPLYWILGRIEEVHPGQDGIVRVVSVRTKKGIYKRNVKKVCVLPID